MSREERAVLAAWERVQAQVRKGSEKQRREQMRASRKSQVPSTPQHTFTSQRTSLLRLDQSVRVVRTKWAKGRFGCAACWLWLCLRSSCC